MPPAKVKVSSLKLAEYLFTRLRQLGIDSVHGVPGDYNLELLDYIGPSGLRWVGNTNELNAAYAADGYARIKGASALITTFGVGELSALNALAGAYAEFAPIIHIVGTPARHAQSSRARIHHTFNDGEYGRFSKMNAHVTAAQTSLWDPRTCAEQIDEALQQCLIHHRPVYIQVPTDLVTALLPCERLETLVTLPMSEPLDHARSTEVLKRILDRIHTAERPIIIADGESRPLRLVEDVQKLINRTQWPTWTTPFGKGLFDETRPNFHGITKGTFDTPEVRAFIASADLVLNFGPHHSASNTYRYSTVPKPEVTISFSGTDIKIGHDVYQDVPSNYIVSHLVSQVDVSQMKVYEPYPELPRDFALSVTDEPPTGSINQSKLWRILGNIVRPGDILLGETGTAGYGVRDILLPPHVRVFLPVTWLSIGYMLPAAQGAALAQQEQGQNNDGYKDRRTILFIGDGSFQMTVQEISTMIRHDLNIIIFLINNDGYTIERCIHGRKQGYNDIARWRYLKAPGLFGAKENAFTHSVRTWGELGEVLAEDRLQNGQGLRMVEIQMDREDAPAPLLKYLENQIASE